MNHVVAIRLIFAPLGLTSTYQWEVGDVAVFNGYTNKDDIPLFAKGDLLVIVEVSTNNPNILSCVKLKDYPGFLNDDPNVVGDEVWSYEIRRP